MANIKTITITDVTQPQINAALIALTSASKGLEVDIKAVDSAWKSANKDLQQQIDNIRRGTLVYTAGSNINISSTGVISVTGIDKVLTLKRNGTSIATFTALALGDASADITVPTKTSELSNDSGFITILDIPTNVSAFNNDAGYLTAPIDLTSQVTNTLPVGNGGTGVTSQNAINKEFVAQLSEGSSDVTDDTMFVSSYASNYGFADTSDNGPNKPYKRKFSKVWNWTKTHLSSDYGLTVDSVTSGSYTINRLLLYKSIVSPGNMYSTASGLRYGMHMNNSDIMGVNGIYTQDSASDYSEGLNFYRRSQSVNNVTHYYYDSMYANSGHFYFGADVDRVDTKTGTTTGAQNSDATLHAAGFVQNGNNVWDNSMVTSFAITVPSTAGTWASNNYTFTAGHPYTFGITGAWSSTTYHGSATFVLNSTSYTYNVFLFSSSGNMTGTTVQINPSSTAFRITGINGSTALGHQMMVSIIDYTK